MIFRLICVDFGYLIGFLGALVFCSIEYGLPLYIVHSATPVLVPNYCKESPFLRLTLHFLVLMCIGFLQNSLLNHINSVASGWDILGYVVLVLMCNKFSIHTDRLVLPFELIVPLVILPYYVFSGKMKSNLRLLNSSLRCDLVLTRELDVSGLGVSVTPSPSNLKVRLSLLVQTITVILFVTLADNLEAKRSFLKINRITKLMFLCIQVIQLL